MFLAWPGSHGRCLTRGCVSSEPLLRGAKLSHPCHPGMAHAGQQSIGGSQPAPSTWLSKSPGSELTRQGVLWPAGTCGDRPLLPRPLVRVSFPRPACGPSPRGTAF